MTELFQQLEHEVKATGQMLQQKGIESLQDVPNWSGFIAKISILMVQNDPVDIQKHLNDANVYFWEHESGFQEESIPNATIENIKRILDELMSEPQSSLTSFRSSF